MFLLLLVIFQVGLLPEVSSLKCLKCQSEANESCTTKECPPDNHCASLKMTISDGGGKNHQFYIRDCLPLPECFVASVNYGPIRTVVTGKCCTTDLCNKQFAPDPSPSRPNGRKCFSCDGNECFSTVNCMGEEDRCISTEVSKGGISLTMKGCATNTICSSSSLLPVNDALGSTVKCCQGDFCNSATSSGASLLLLVVPFISLVLFS